ncbi:hypothetical protein AB0M10_21235 [Streptomyces sp. NPDC051840]|uniref:hypothetical protein n=1 Tax=Streptomyces sp. NPDC051840 TaxID=3154752 RepID=UPI0034376474
MRQGVHLGTLVLARVDQPWFVCGFRATSDWEASRPTVEAWTRAVDGDDEDEMICALEAVDALGLSLVPVAGAEAIGDFLIHVEGRTARFRY